MSSEEERAKENTPTQGRNDIPFEKGYQPERSNLRSPVIHLREGPAFLQNHRLAQAKLRKTSRRSILSHGSYEVLRILGPCSDYQTELRHW